MEIFGSNRTTNPLGQTAGSEFAQIIVGERVTLAQQAQIQYARPVRPIISIGDPHIYFNTGQGQGSVNVGRIIGPEGVFHLLNSGNAGKCGTISALQVQVGGGRCMIAPTKTLSFGGAMFSGVSMGITVNPEIVEQYQIMISSLELVG